MISREEVGAESVFVSAVAGRAGIGVVVVVIAGIVVVVFVVRIFLQRDDDAAAIRDPVRVSHAQAEFWDKYGFIMDCYVICLDV